MIAIAFLFVRMLCDCFKSRRRLEAEILVLRHQLNVLRQRAPRRLHLRWADRALFIWLYRRCPRILDAITIVRPETVVRWHRMGFAAYWRWKSRPLGGRPRIGKEVRDLIRRMSFENPLWGAPKIHGELLNGCPRCGGGGGPPFWGGGLGGRGTGSRGGGAPRWGGVGPRRPLTSFVAVTRARGARREQTDPLEPPGRRCACWPPSPISFLRIPVGGERWSSGVGSERSCGRRRRRGASNGVDVHNTPIAKSAALGSPPCFLSDISGWSLSLGGGRRADMQQSDPLARPAGRRRRFLFRECRIGATMAPAPGELSDLRGRRAQHPDRDRTEMGSRINLFCRPYAREARSASRLTRRRRAAASDRRRRFLFSSPPGLAGPAAHETLLLCGRVVGTEVGIPLVRLSPIFSWTRGSWSTSDCCHGPSSAPEHAS